MSTSTIDRQRVLDIFMESYRRPDRYEEDTRNRITRRETPRYITRMFRPWPQLSEVVHFAMKVLESKVRECGNPAIAHAFDMTCRLMRVTDNPLVLKAAILHDMVEDTAKDIRSLEQRLNEIRTGYGPELARVVGQLTNVYRIILQEVESNLPHRSRLGFELIASIHRQRLAARGPLRSGELPRLFEEIRRHIEQDVLVRDLGFHLWLFDRYCRPALSFDDGTLDPDRVRACALSAITGALAAFQNRSREQSYGEELEYLAGTLPAGLRERYEPPIRLMLRTMEENRQQAGQRQRSGRGDRNYSFVEDLKMKTYARYVSDIRRQAEAGVRAKDPDAAASMTVKIYDAVDNLRTVNIARREAIQKVLTKAKIVQREVETFIRLLERRASPVLSDFVAYDLVLQFEIIMSLTERVAAIQQLRDNRYQFSIQPFIEEQIRLYTDKFKGNFFYYGIDLNSIDVVPRMLAGAGRPSV